MGQLIKMTGLDVGVDLFNNLSPNLPGLAEAWDSPGYPKNSIPTADYTCVSQNRLKNWRGSVGQLIKMTDFDVGVDLFHNLSLRASRGLG